jgi:hypothetical protein
MLKASVSFNRGKADERVEIDVSHFVETEETQVNGMRL